MKRLIPLLLTVSLTVTAFSVHAEIVVVVSAKSTVSDLDQNQVSSIFLGKTDTFPDGTQAMPIEQIEGSAPHEEFHALVTRKSIVQLKSYWAKMVFSGKGNPPKEAQNSAEVLQLVAANPNMIGYLEKSLVNSKLKVVFSP